MEHESGKTIILIRELAKVLKPTTPIIYEHSHFPFFIPNRPFPVGEGIT